MCCLVSLALFLWYSLSLFLSLYILILAALRARILVLWVQLFGWVHGVWVVC